MKRIKFFAVAAIFCAAGYAGYTAYDKATMTDQERLTLANIEALTEIEVVITCSNKGCGQCYTWDNDKQECKFSGYQQDSCAC